MPPYAHLCSFASFVIESKNCQTFCSFLGLWDKQHAANEIIFPPQTVIMIYKVGNIRDRFIQRQNTSTVTCHAHILKIQLHL